MKHVRESLNQFYDYQFFRMFEEDEKAELKDKEKDGLAVIEKLKKNFDDFKKNSKGEILKFKEFWEENKKTKEGFSENGDVYKMFDSDYVIGVLELPVETLSDGSIDGGFGATDEPEEEIIEGPELEPSEEKPEEEKPTEDFFEEQQVPTNEAEEGEDDLDLDLDLGDEEGKDISGELDTPEEAPVKEPKAEEEPVEIPELPDSGTEEPTEAPVEEPVSSEPAPDLTAPQTYLVVYDISGDEREEIFRCGSNNVVNAFKEFYNDTFKGSMKAAILNYKEQKEQEKVKAEKSEKEKAQSDKQSKLKKFLGENLNEESFDEQEFLDNEDEDEDMELENDEYLEDEELDNEEVEDLEDDEFAGDDDELNYDDDELNDEEYDDDDLADYEWEVGKYITDTLRADDIEYDEDNFGEIMRDRIETVLDCMKSEVSAEECGQQLMNDEDFMAELTNVE